MRDDDVQAKTSEIAALARQRDAAIAESAKERKDLEAKMADQMARQSIGIRSTARDGSAGNSAEVRRRLFEERRKMIEAEDRAEVLEAERQSRQEIEKNEKLLELSRKSRSRGAKQRDDSASQRAGPPRAVSPQVNMINLKD